MIHDVKWCPTRGCGCECLPIAIGSVLQACGFCERDVSGEPGRMMWEPPIRRDMVRELRRLAREAV